MARKSLIQIRRDTAANWTSTNPVLAAGEQGYETDTGFSKIGDGTTAWTSLAHERPKGQATVFNVDEHGAAVDGVTDDLIAINNLIDSVSAAGGGDICFSDISAVSGPVVVKDNVTLFAHNRQGGLKLLDGSNKGVITNNNAELHNVKIKDLYIDANGDNQTGNSSMGQAAIYIGGTGATELDNVVIDNVAVINPYKHGIFITGDESTFRQKVVKNCYVYDHGSVSVVGYGIYVDFAPGTVIKDNTVELSNGNDAIEIGHMGAICLHNDIVDGQLQFPFGDNSVIAFNTVRANTIQNDANPADNVALIGNQVLNATPSSGFGGISVYGENPTIMGNVVKVTDESGIRVYHGHGGTISGNQVDGTNKSTGGNNGIYSDSSDNVSIFGNHAKNFARGAVVVLDDNSVVGNTFDTCTVGLELSDSASSGHIINSVQVGINTFVDCDTNFEPNNQQHYHMDMDVIPLNLNGGLTSASIRPSLNSNPIRGEIHGYSATSKSSDDGFLRLSAGGGTNPATAKAFIDLSGYSAVDDMSNNVVIGTGGVERARVEGDGRLLLTPSAAGSDVAIETIRGNVGLGTATPQTTLHVVDDTAGGITLDRTTTNDGESSVINLKYNAGASWAGRISAIKVSGGGGKLRLATGDATGSGVTDRVFVEQDGSLGLGVVPSNTQHILATNGKGITLDRSGTTDDETSVINFKYNSDGAWAGKIVATKVSGGGGKISIFTGDAGGASTTERVTISQAGAVGATSFTGSGAGLTAIPESAVTNLVSDLAAKAADSAVVHNTGNESVQGKKTLTGVATGERQAIRLENTNTGAGDNVAMELKAANLTNVAKIVGEAPGGGKVDLVLYVNNGSTTAELMRLSGSSVKISGGHQCKVTTTGSNLTLDTTHDTVVFTATATATLPAATGSGQTYRLICRTGTLTIDPNGAETVQGAATLALTAGQSVIITDTASGLWE